MKSIHWSDVGMFVLLVTLGVGARLYFQDIPNFAPVAALALFAGYYFRQRLLALAAPLTVMAISDMFIGGYQPAIMATVYAMLAAPALCGGLLRSKSQDIETNRRAAFGWLAALVGCSLASSLVFFVVTNFACWVFTMGAYDRSLAGLLECYYFALPFFRFTLYGDLSFALLLFGGQMLLTALAGTLADSSLRVAPAEVRRS